MPSPAVFFQELLLSLVTDDHYLSSSHSNTPGEPFTEFKCPGGTGNAGTVILVAAHVVTVQNMTPAVY